jgi:hypothetical protein
MRLIGWLNLFMAGLNFALFLFGGYSWYNLAVIPICLFGAFLNKTTENKEEDAIKQRIQTLRDKTDRMRVNPRYFLDEYYYELHEEASQLELLQLRRRYYRRTLSEQATDFIFRTRYPDREDYTESRAFWLNAAIGWKNRRRFARRMNQT